MNDNSESIYFEFLTLLKKYLFLKVQFILFKKFPFLFDTKESIKKENVLNAKKKYELYEKTHKQTLDKFYLLRLKKRLSEFEFELLCLLFFNAEDLKFNALIKKIKDPDKIPLSDEDYYEINLNEALEILILDEKEKYLIRKNFLLNSYLITHRVVSFIFSDNVMENPLIFNENLKLSVNVINKLMGIDEFSKIEDPPLNFNNRLRIGRDNI